MRCTIPAILALFALHSSLVTLPAAVPLRWTVETSRAQVAQFESYRGETLELEATMKSYGSPLAAPVQPSLYWQTNGMGAAWWTSPATASGNVLRATWSPTNDCGGTVYNCFIGQAGGNYRAAFRLRMLPSPGYTPNHLPLPTVKDEIDPVFSAWLATNDFSSAGVDTNAVKDLITSATNGLATAADLGGYLPLTGGTLTGDLAVWAENGANGITLKGGTSYGSGSSLTIGGSSGNGGTLKVIGGGTDGGTMFVGGSPFTGGKLTVQGGGSRGGIIEVTEAGASIKKDGKEVATEDQVEAVNNRVESLGTTVNAWQTYWDGDDVRITVTNYYGSLDIPSLYLEQKMPAGDGHDAPWFRVVWDERTRWNTFMPAYTAVTNEIAQNKADRAWGVYDSSTGAYSPDGLLQVSQEQIMIASGMAYQKTVTAGGCAVWVLKATNPTSFSGELENGYFRITDGDGNALFEIVKGNKRVVGAVATDVQVSSVSMTIRYNSVSDQHPVLEVCTDLSRADWQREDEATVASVAWSGSSGAWVATVTPVGARPHLFAKASYEAGGNTYIKNHVASSLDKVVVGGQEYTVTVQTINGKKLLVLE